MEISGYQIDRKIGKGGMATVYLAKQISLDRPVVLKVLDIAKQTENDTQIERFLSEGRIVASLNHPNIITIYDIGIADDNSIYISMEYIEGGDLKSRIGIPMEPGEALDIVMQITRGLQLAHQHGIVHRDVKPANILFRNDNTPLITDFGIAKRVNDDLSLTSTGIFLGSPNYVSPEQATGDPVDARSDIYSLGCILYEMLTGEKPYKASTVFDVVMQHKEGPIPRLPEDTSEYQPLIDRMMAKDPDDRPADAEELLEIISDIYKEISAPNALLDFDLSGSTAAMPAQKQGISKYLLVALVISTLFFASLYFIEIRMRTDTVNLDTVPVNTAQNLVSTQDLAKSHPADKSSDTITDASPEVISALLWLGKQSLEEYRLTSPPKDNAYYYFSRLLDIDPDGESARTGMLEIANRYAFLAEQTLAEGDHKKTEAYINLGLNINPDNQTLLTLKQLNQETKQSSFFERITGWFNN